MREAFAYESDASLLRQLLVPDPLSPDSWEVLEKSWRGDRRPFSLLEWLVADGHLEEEMLLHGLAQSLGVSYLLEREIRPDAGISPEEQLLERNGFILVRSGNGGRLLAGGATLPPGTRHLVPHPGGIPPWVLVSPLRHSGNVSLPKAPPGEGSAGSMEAWLRELVAGQLSRGARDIHFERAGNELKIRIHKDAAIRTIGEWTDGRAVSCLLILKRWAGMRGGGTTLPQDGRFRLDDVRGKQVLRMSHLATVEGESAVLRVSRSGSHLRNLGSLGLPPALGGELVHMVRHETGMLLLTGSTGSGKTTTAYALLNELREDGVKILTIEDPVEYELDFAVQSSVDHNTGWDFPRALRAFLRQDPDVVFLGEMRDRNSAEVACRAALTGHAVLATLHAGSVRTAMDRLRGWGIPQGILAETIRIVVHQRLVQPATGEDSRAEFEWWIPAPEEVAGARGPKIQAVPGCLRNQF